MIAIDRKSHPLGGSIEVLFKPLEKPAPIGRTQRRFHVILRMRHHAEHVAACVDDTRNRVGGAVEVPFRREGAVGRRVAEHHAALALEARNSLGVCDIIAFAVGGRHANHLAGIVAARERRIGTLDPQIHLPADELEPRIAHQHTRQQAGLAENLKSVADAEHEAALLPGVLMRNTGLKFVCREVYLRVERSDTPFTRGYNAGQVICVPTAHGEGNYVADSETIARLEGESRGVFRYTAPDGTLAPAWNLHGATNAIAGIVNARGNVLGMMPHPENHVEAALGPTDGRGLFQRLAGYLDRAA